MASTGYRRIRYLETLQAVIGNPTIYKSLLIIYPTCKKRS